MGKAISGAAMLVGAGAIEGVLDFASAGALTPFLFSLEASLLAGGISAEAGAVASALSNNRGTSISVRQAAAYRQVVRGRRRLGGIKVYQSTTGSHKDQVNYVIAVASHTLYAFTGLYLDGRLVYWIPGKPGYTTRNGSNFGGTCDSSTYTGPDGVQYNFGGKVYCEPRFGDQAAGDVIGGLTANDPVWAARNGRSPYGGGVAYVYIKREHDPDLFPQEPEIKLAVAGKCDIYDPRSGTRGYTDNWALHVADHLSDPLAGFGDPYINEDQLIAAANICDEQVALAQGAYERRYGISAAYDTSMAPDNILNSMLQCAAGRVRQIGGEWHIFPGAWQGPSVTFDQGSLCGGIVSEPVLGLDEKCNRVTGTYTAPNYPYNVAGDLYDSNGYYNGQIQNNWPFAWQPTSFPQYARDPAHGYASAEDLNEDSGVQGAWAAGTMANEDDVYTHNDAIWRSLVDGSTDEPAATSPNWVNGALYLTKDLQLDWVISITQAQRLAKIALMKSRYQGKYQLPMFLTGYRMQPLDVMNFTLPELGWSDKVLEVDNPKLSGLSPDEGRPAFAYVNWSASETGPDIYEWSTEEEQTVYAAQALPSNSIGTAAPPTGLTLVSGAAVALQQPDGSIVPRIQANWSTPLDAYVTDIQIQARLTGTTTWTDYPAVDVSLNAGYISPVISGQKYDVRIRSRRSSRGSTSAWEEIDGFTAELVLAVQTQDGIGIGSLYSQAFANGTAAITCTPFSAPVGNQTLNYFPSGGVTINTNGTLSAGVAVGGPLAQQTQYFVYFSDPGYAGGDVTPIATTNRADFQGKLGCFLIDSIVTGYANSSGSSNRYPPSNATDSGTQSTQSAQAAYDGDLTTYASVGGSANDVYTPEPSGGPVGSSDPFGSNGVCTFEDFPNLTTTADMTLTVSASATFRALGGGTVGSGSIVATVAGTSSTLWSDSAPLAATNLTLSIPRGTNLSDVSVTVDAEPGEAVATSSHRAPVSVTTIKITEIYIS